MIMKSLLVDGNTEQDLSENIYTILNDCYKAFKTYFFDGESIITCKLFLLLNGSDKDHIAPACNIASSIEDLRCFFESIGINGKGDKNPSLSFVHIKIFITLFFYIYQQLDIYHKFIFQNRNVVSLDYYAGNFEQNKDGQDKNRTIKILKAYANYFKHPKLITHIHHPLIYIEHKSGSEIDLEYLSDDILIQVFERKCSNDDLERFLKIKKPIFILKDLTVLIKDVASITMELIEFSLNVEFVKEIILEELSCKLGE